MAARAEVGPHACFDFVSPSPLISGWIVGGSMAVGAFGDVWLDWREYEIQTAFKVSTARWDKVFRDARNRRRCE
jgi:hypothetical protein